MPDDHSKLVPLLPIPNRTVKRLRADDSAGSRVKVGHRQALTAQTALQLARVEGVLLWGIGNASGALRKWPGIDPALWLQAHQSAPRTSQTPMMCQ